MLNKKSGKQVDINTSYEQINASSQDIFFEEPISLQEDQAAGGDNVSSTISSSIDDKIDLVDEAYMQMGGFGRLQKISYIANTLA